MKSFPQKGEALRKGTWTQRGLYDREDFWQEYDGRDWIKRKAQLIADIIPDDVVTVLDVGCGSGSVSARAAETRRVIGLDVARAAVSRAPFPAVVGFSSQLPFKDGSFDCVLCSEVLEHLPDQLLEPTARELARVSKRYLLITVPDREPFEKNFVRCPDCGSVFNISGHLRRFSVDSLSALFSGTRLLKCFSWGPTIRDYWQPLLRLRQRIGGKYSPLADGKRQIVCPRCGGTNFPAFKHNLISLLCDGLNAVLYRRRPYWLFALYEKMA